MNPPAALWMLTAAASVQGPPDWLKPRDLPSLVVSWRVEVDACDVRVHGGTVLVLSEEVLSAYESDTGDVLWQQKEAGSDCIFDSRQLHVAEGGIFVATSRGIYRVDERSGDVTEFLALGRVTDFFSPPLLAAVEEESGSHFLVRLDPLSGREEARTPLPGTVGSIAATPDVVVVAPYEEDKDELFALRADDLSEVWRRDGYSGVEEIGGEIYLRKLGDRNHASYLERVDPATGRITGRLPRREDDWCCSQDELDWELQFLRESDRHRVRRNRVPSGEAAWTADLPGSPRDTLRLDDRLYVHCRGHGRGILVVLDWDSGRLLSSAFGIRGALLHALGVDRLVLEGDDEVVVASTTFGPPESALYPVEEEIRKILSQELQDWNLGEPYGDLEALGPEAHPILARELPALSWLWIQVVAPLLAKADYEGAVEPLLEVLHGRPLPQRTERHGHRAAAEALARLGGPTAVSVLAEMLRSEEQRYLHVVAFTGLVDIGTPEAVAAADAYVRARRIAYRFEPPTPLAYLDLVGVPYDEEAAERAAENEDWTELTRLVDGARATEVPLPAGGALVVYANPYTLGSSKDLWAVERDAEGRLRETPTYLGLAAPGDGCYLECQLEVDLQGDVLVVGRSDVDAPGVTVNLVEARRDTDGDGLADWVESRLTTDPARRDTDGDGREDAVDDEPDALVREASDEEAELLESAAEQYFLLTNADWSPSRLALLQGSVARDWRRPGPTLTLDDPAELKKRLGSDLLPIYSIEPIAAEELATLRDRIRFEESDRVFRIVRSVGPLDASSHLLVLRRFDGRWLIRQIGMEWIS